jgi:protein SCO1/2
MMRVWMRSTVGLIVMAMCLTVVGCGGTSSETKSGPAAQPEQRYDLKGTVVSLDKSKGAVTVNHDEIKGFMAAMTMPYPVKDTKALDSLEAGDTMTAKLVSNGESYWLEDVKVIDHAKK